MKDEFNPTSSPQSVLVGPFRDRKRRPSVEQPSKPWHHTPLYRLIYRDSGSLYWLIIIPYIQQITMVLVTAQLSMYKNFTPRHLLRCCMLLVLTTRAWWHSMGEQLNSPVYPMLWWMFGIPRGFNLVAVHRVIQTYLPGFLPHQNWGRQIREVTLMSCSLWTPIFLINPYFWGGYVRGVYVEQPWRVSC